MKRYYRKLIRDNIPYIMDEKSVEYETTVVLGEEYRLELKRKLVEESEEVSHVNTKGELIDELADVLEVVRAFQKEYEIDDQLLSQKVQDRLEKKGGFSKKIFLIWSEDKEE